MSNKKLNKKATGNKIISHANSSISMSIDAKAFWQKFKTDKDFLDACEFCRIEPIYH